MKVTIEDINTKYRTSSSFFDHAGHLLMLVQLKTTGECFTIRVDLGQSEDLYTLTPVC